MFLQSQTIDISCFHQCMWIKIGQNQQAETLSENMTCIKANHTDATLQ